MTTRRAIFVDRYFIAYSHAENQEKDREKEEEAKREREREFVKDSEIKHQTSTRRREGREPLQKEKKEERQRKDLLGNRMR